MNSKSYKKPNFFIIGAPKCGTTALSEYLKGHPNLFFSKEKEPFFFNDDLTGKEKLISITPLRGVEEYLEKEFDGSAEYRVVGEGTAMYLFSHTAVPNILKFNPEAKFIVMVRNPIDMAHSFHSQIFLGLMEDVKDFEAAWKLQKERHGGKNLPRHCKVLQILQYGEICKLGEQLDRLYKIVPREKVLVIVYDDFRKDPLKEYKKVLDFLGLDYDRKGSFEPVNINREVSKPKIHKLVVSAMRLKKKLGINRNFGLANKLLVFYAKEKKRIPLSGEFRAELREYFKNDINLLSSLIGRNLSSWE